MIRSRLRSRGGGGSPWFTQGKADGVDPTLWADFVNNRYAVNGVAVPFADVFTYTRASTATYFDASGVMQTAAVNAPRFDYDPVTHAPKGILIEESRTNLVNYSADATNAAWAGWDGTKTWGYPAPDGTATATLCAGPAPTAASRGGITASSTSLTFSIYVKYVSGSATKNFLVRNDTTATSLLGGTANILTGTISGTNYSMTNAGNGWWRVSVFITSGINIGDQIRLYYGTTSALLNPDSWLVWGAQLEQGTFPTSYIPTTTAAVTRAADSCSNSAANVVPFASWYNDTMGSLTSRSDVIPYDVTIPGTAYSIASLNDGTSSNQWGIRYDTGGTGIGMPFAVGGSNQVTLVPLPAPVPLGVNSFAHAMSLGTRSAVVNGGSIQPGAYSSGPTITNLDIGKNLSATYLNGWIEKIKYYPIRVTNSELARITT